MKEKESPAKAEEEKAQEAAGDMKVDPDKQSGEAPPPSKPKKKKKK